MVRVKVSLSLPAFCVERARKPLALLTKGLSADVLAGGRLHASRRCLAKLLHQSALKHRLDYSGADRGVERDRDLHEVLLESLGQLDNGEGL